MPKKELIDRTCETNPLSLIIKFLEKLTEILMNPVDSKVMELTRESFLLISMPVLESFSPYALPPIYSLFSITNTGSFRTFAILSARVNSNSPLPTITHLNSELFNIFTF